MHPLLSSLRRCYCDDRVGNLLLCRWRDCYSDEHYIPTLLSVLGKEDETDCKGYMTAVDWTQSDDGHPRHYHPEEISTER